MTLVQVDKRTLSFPRRTTAPANSSGEPRPAGTDSPAPQQAPRPTVADILQVTNGASCDVAFKVMTTAAQRYVVRPSTGVIPTGRSIPVRFIADAASISDNDGQSKDKFLLRTAEAPSSSVFGVSNSFWRDRPRGDFEDLKLRVNFVDPSCDADDAFRKRDPKEILRKHVLHFPAAATNSRTPLVDTLHVTNTTSQDLAFQVEASTETRYLVEPESGLVPRDASLELKFEMLHPPLHPIVGLSKDELLLRVAEVDGEDAWQLPENFWLYRKGDPDVFDIKYRVKFEGNNDLQRRLMLEKLDVALPADTQRHSILQAEDMVLASPVTGGLHVSNIASSDVAFKIKTTNQGGHQVRPCHGIIPTGASRSVQISIRPQSVMKTKDKVMLVVTKAPGIASWGLQGDKYLQLQNASDRFDVKIQVRFEGNAGED